MPAEWLAIVPLLHAAATWFMVGLIWFVQVVHYPLMSAVPADSACAYAVAHQRQTTWVVGPVMLIEAATTIAMFWTPAGVLHATPLCWVGLGLLAAVWLLTAFVQVPLHGKLAASADAAAAKRLVRTNWFRTAAWSARGVVALLLLV